METKEKGNIIEIAAEPKNLDLAIEFISRVLEESGFDKKSILQTSVAAEEIFVNICQYAYVPGKGTVLISISLQDENNRAVIRFVDKGKKFNPLDAPSPDVTLPARERKEGGLGIFMAQRLVSRIGYQYVDGTNILTITKQKPTEAKQYGNKQE